MGIGNLTNVLRAYASAPADIYLPDLVEEDDLSWPRVFFDTAPDQNGAAHALLARLGDDSPTYYWRVLAAREIMRLFRDDPERLQELDLLHRAKASHEEVLHPPAETERFADPVDVQRAWDAHSLQPLPDEPVRLGFAIDRTMGELASQLGQPKELYRGLRAEALALLVYMAGRVQEISRATQPLEVTSTVRDETYQAAPPRRESRGHPRLLPAHDRIRVRRPPPLRIGRAGAGVSVRARRPHGARADRVDPRAGGNPRHSGDRGRGSRAERARA